MNNQSTPSQVLKELLDHAEQQYDLCKQEYKVLDVQAEPVKTLHSIGKATGWLDVQSNLLNHLKRLQKEPGYTHVFNTPIASRFSEAGLVALFVGGVLIGMSIMLMVLR